MAGTHCQEAKQVPSLVFSLVVDLGGHNKNRFPTIASPPIGLR
jgi:hypothetical protein